MDLPSAVSRIWPWLAASLVALVVFELLRFWIGRKVRGWRHRWIARRALRGEAHAEKLLEHAGYRIVGRQVERDYVVRIDGKGTRVLVRADLLVQDAQGQTLVAEVKTGREAPRIENSATRRQLLEYRVAFDVPGVLLVDAGTDLIRHVHFPIAERPEPDPLPSLRAVTLGIVLGMVGSAGIAAALLH